MKNSETIDPGLIDVRRRMKELSVEELCDAAEEFFAQRINWDSLHAKPFAEIDETPELLTCFAQVVRGLELLPEMTVLDFGAGSCWTSHFLSQLGLKVIALDVSPSALKIGQRLYQKHPIIGNQPEPQFLQFDGQRFDLPDNSVDRISCFEAFHHVPNPEQVIREMGRVLKPGGIAGFSEPGPEHSKTPQAQNEMRANRIIENDIDVREIWGVAQKAGFTEIKLALMNPNAFLLPLEEFEAYLTGANSGQSYLAETRRQMQHRRVFFLFKGASAAPADSRHRAGLMAELSVECAATRVAASKPLPFKATVKNSGTSVWLPTRPDETRSKWRDGLRAASRGLLRLRPIPLPARLGSVRFGIQLFDQQGSLLNIDYFRHSLTPGEGREILPGETVEFTAEVVMPAAGKYILHCDLVSEMVCWFEHNGSAPVRLDIEAV
jgi:SAM-dependent methyltransferase